MKLLLAYCMTNVKLNQSAIKCMSDTIGKLNQEFFFLKSRYVISRHKKKNVKKGKGKEGRYF